MPTVGIASVTSMKRFAWLAAQGERSVDRIDVVAVDDQAAPAAAILERRADRAGLAAGQRRHRVEQMGEAA